MTEPILSFLHGCCGTYDLDGCTGYSRFTPEQLAYYGSRSDADFVRSHSPAGIYLECITCEPVISLTYRLYRDKGWYVMNSGIDVEENGVFAAHFAVDFAETGNVTLTYTRRCREPSVIRIWFPNGCVFLPVDFQAGNALPTPEREAKILFYGDSVTQSAYIPNPSLSWFVLVAQHLDAGYLNRGIGSMIFDRNSLPAETDCRPAHIFIEYGGNDLGKIPDNDTALAAADAWLARLCILYPDAEKYAVLPDFFPEESEAILCRLDDYCRGLTGLCRTRGIAVFSGKPLVPALPSMFCGDMVHFSEAGSAVFADRLLYAVRRRTEAENIGTP